MGLLSLQPADQALLEPSAHELTPTLQGIQACPESTAVSQVTLSSTPPSVCH